MAIKDVSALSLEHLISLQDRVAVVTGGAGGIGAAISHRLAEAGATVIVADINSTAAQATATRLTERYGTPALATHLDVTDSAAIAATADQAVQAFGRLDIWVNNAGVYPSVTALETSDDAWDSVLNLNLRSVFIGGREAAKHMIAGGRGGVIINVASTAAFKTGGGNAIHYISSKHGVVGVTKSLAVELGAHGIRVLAVAPTLVLQTPGIQEKQDWLDSVGMSTVLQDYGATLPLGRAGVPDDIARVVLFGASDLATFMSGSVLFADAGDMAQ